jgi:hypothetical protein
MRPFGCLLLAAASLFGAGATELSQAQIDEIVQKFAAKEAEFAKAREVYTYHQTARIQELDDAGGVTGRWETISDIIFSPEGKRTEKVTRSPVPTLKQITLTPEDLKDMQDVQPFVLTTNELPKYLIRYLGHQIVDEIGCHVFAVKPKKLEGNDRYFAGLVWVDDRDLQIVKTYGRGVGTASKKGQAFPKFETYREQIDGKYWFPTYTIANDTLHFPNGDDVRIRQTMRYEDYKQFKAETKITFGDEVKDDKTPPTPPSQKPPVITPPKAPGK